MVKITAVMSISESFCIINLLLRPISEKCRAVSFTTILLCNCQILLSRYNKYPLNPAIVERIFSFYYERASS